MLGRFLNKSQAHSLGRQGKNTIQGKDLLFFDEIQEAPKAVKSLRYFCELMPEFLPLDSEPKAAVFADKSAEINSFAWDQR
jgi:predicted AAA+ superfamily ATPase